MPFSGSAKYTNWATLSYNGVSNPTIASEQIPVLFDSLTKYSLAIEAAADNANWASGFTLTLTFYSNTNSVVSSVTSTTTNLVAGVHVTPATTPTLAPSGSANGGYCIGTLQYNGTPAVTNPLDVFSLRIVTSLNPNVPDILNYNYGFVNGTYPWAVSNSAILEANYNPLLGSDGNFDSLVIGGIIEVMGGPGGVPCQVPNLTDPVSGNSVTFRISTPGGQLQTLSQSGSGPYDLGDFQPTQDFVESLLLDGERPFGTRSSNRQMVIPIGIYAPTQQTLDAARDYLLSVINQEQFEVAWTPKSNGLTTIYECFRALPSTIMYGFNNLREGASGAPAIGLITVNIQALPFGKSGIDGTVEIDFSSGLVSGNPATAANVLDSTANGTPTASRWNFAAPTSATTSFNVAAAATPIPAGDAIFVFVSSVTNNITGVTDASGNTYTLVKSTGNQAGTMFLFVFATFGCAQLSGTVTVSMTGAAAAYLATVWKVTGPIAVRNSASFNGSSAIPTGTLAGACHGDYTWALPFGLGSAGGVDPAWAGLGIGENANGYNWWNVQKPQSSSGVNGTVTYTGSGAPNWGLILIDFAGPIIDVSNNWIQNTQFPVIGTSCAFHRNATPVVSPYAPVVYESSYVAENIVGLPVLSVWLGQSYDNQWAADPKFVSNVTLTAVMTDINGKQISFKTTVNKVPWNATPTKPAWKQISLPIPQKNPKFSYNAVINTRLTITNYTGGGQAGYVRMNAWIGYVSAQPLSIANVSSPRGILYNMFGLAGSARAPVNAQIQLPNTDPVVQEYTQSGLFQVPIGLHSLQAECWAAGGAGSSVNSTIPGGGGGAGEYAIEPTLTVTPGQKIPMAIGAGGQSAQLVPTVLQFLTHGIGTTWTCPANVTSATVECTGGGAAGAPGGGGGGAGGYTKNTVTTVPGTVYAMWVGNGGAPNTGTTSQANLARNGQNTWFGLPGTKTLSGALCGAQGGSTALAGSAEGGVGGSPVAATGAATLVQGYHGGGGGRSPGGAGGGGGAAPNSTGPGLFGSASPKLGASGAGDYLTGGAGGTGPGGNGGTGANVPGAATPPDGNGGRGGGGGGGYTKTVTASGKTTAVNYQGSTGGPGVITVTYTVNAGNPINGGNTVFGSAATTSKTVTANGGTSVAANTGSGAAGGTGSANSGHNNGGTGGLSNRNADGLFTTRGTGGQISLSHNSASAATSVQVTAGATLTAAQMQPGVILMAAVMTSAALVNATATDNAGNIYYLARTQALTDGSQLYVFVSTLKFPVTSTNILTVSNDTTSTNWLAQWGAITGVRDLEDTVIASAAGATSTFSVARTYPDTSASYCEVVVIGNNGTSTSQAGLNVQPGTNGFGGNTSGTLGLNFAVRAANGSASAVSLSGALGGTFPWAGITLPFLLANQNGQLIPTNVNSAITGTTGTITNAAPASVNMDAGTGMHIVRVHVSGSTTSTVAVTDNGSGGSNTYTLKNSVVAGTGKIYVFAAPVTNSLSGSWTMTVTSSVSSTYTVSSFFCPGATAVDATGTATNTGTGTAVSLVYPSTTSPSDLQFAVVGYANATSLLSTASWTAPNVGAQLYDGTNAAPVADNHLVLQQNATATPTLSVTLSSSVTWGAVVISIVTPDISGGGGSSGGVGNIGVDGTNGLSGGGPSYSSGGKGANGVTGNTNGATGAVPGGAGAGASRVSGSGSFTGGNGANGMIRVTYQPPLIGFNDFLIHRPGENAPMDLNPLIPIPVADPPDNREYAVPSTIAGRNAVFRGTYTVILCNSAWDSPSTTRRISVTINQYEYPGGPAVSVQATRTLTPATDIVNGYVSMGEITLPIKSVSESNSDSYYTVSIHDTDQNDSFQDLMMLDTQGQTFLVNIAPGTAGDSRYVNYYIDEPDNQYDLGKVLGSSHERDRAISVLDMAMVTGGPLYVAPGDNLLLAYSTKGAPNLQVTYSPRWFSDRVT